MQCLYAIIFTGIIAMLNGCTNVREDRSTSEIAALANEGLDTLIYSSPASYSLTLENGDGTRHAEIRTYTEMFDLYEELNYTPEAWQAGIREVPRVYLPLIGDRWGKIGSKEITVDNKKRLFFRTLAPLILRANELIMVDRNRLNDIRSSYTQNNSIEDKDESWIIKLARLYKVNADDGRVTKAMLTVLWERVDIVPVSLALAQAAEESGWGTSRFAALGNAVYGQWTWGNNAMTPDKQRKELGNYGIASFGSLQESVCAYMLNLNTHDAYAGLRNKRAELREKNEKITGHILAGQLTKYSERGEEYVKTLRSLMEYNRLSPADDAFLSSDPPIYMVPTAD